MMWAYGHFFNMCFFRVEVGVVTFLLLHMGHFPCFSGPGYRAVHDGRGLSWRSVRGCERR